MTPLPLTYKEFELLQYLVLREGRTIDRAELISSAVVGRRRRGAERAHHRRARAPPALQARGVRKTLCAPSAESATASTVTPTCRFVRRRLRRPTSSRGVPPVESCPRRKSRPIRPRRHSGYCRNVVRSRIRSRFRDRAGSRGSCRASPGRAAPAPPNSGAIRPGSHTRYCRKAVRSRISLPNLEGGRIRGAGSVGQDPAGWIRVRSEAGPCVPRFISRATLPP